MLPSRAWLEAKLWDVDSEGEQVTLCAHCLLPVGEASWSSIESAHVDMSLAIDCNAIFCGSQYFLSAAACRPQVSYSGQQGKSTSMHGECAAQQMLQEMKEKDTKRVKDASLK